jgi:uncharacterized protein YigA (DUF484 family)
MTNPHAENLRRLDVGDETVEPNALESAAAEIERLTADFEKSCTANHALEREVAGLRHENARLREALTDLLVAVKENDGSAQDEHTVQQYCTAAKSALERSNHIADASKMVERSNS